MRMTFKVTYDDGREVDAVAKPKDVVEFERHYRVSFMTFGPSSPMEWLYYLAWSPLNRTGADPRDFEAFMDDVASIEAVEDVVPVPTELAASEGSSPA